MGGKAFGQFSDGDGTGDGGAEGAGTGILKQCVFLLNFISCRLLLQVFRIEGITCDKCVRLITEVENYFKKMFSSSENLVFMSPEFEIQALQDLPGVGEAVVNKQISTATAR